LKLAEHQLKAGTVTKLDVVRAKTRLAEDNARKQEILRARHAAYFQLERVINIPLGSLVKLSDSLAYFDEAVPAVRESIAAAVKDRIEMSIADAKVDLKKRTLSQARNERLPKVSVAGDYGRAGETPKRSVHDVAELGVQVSMPVFEGGRIEGQIQEERSQQRQQEILREDLAVQVEEDDRLSWQTLLTTKEEVKAAGDALDLATQEVELVRNQYADGVTTNVTVTDSQATLERAREAYVSALAQYHMARVNYYSALGKMEAFHLTSL
jgi:outer membrane protein TolC